jgi:ribosome biogenesis GTPase
MTGPDLVETGGLGAWGWNPSWAAAFGTLARSDGEGSWPARVIAQHRGLWLLASELGERSASLTGRFRHEAGDGEVPAVGDWVACVRSPHDGEARIDSVLPRRSAFMRRAAGSRVGAQVVAANVDTLFVATSLNGELNPRRLERYVAMGHESGAEPVVLLTKADLVEAADDSAARLEAELRVAVVAISARSGEGIESVGRWFAPGKTLTLVGSSGVGKSTLLNRLAGEELMATREIREDDARGRHTTTHRELFLLANGALVLDTPGMREFGLWDADEGVDETFPRSSNSQPAAASSTARTSSSPAARCGRQSPTAGSTQDGSRATAVSPIAGKTTFDRTAAREGPAVP